MIIHYRTLGHNTIKLNRIRSFITIEYVSRNSIVFKYCITNHVTIIMLVTLSCLSHWYAIFDYDYIVNTK